MMGCTARSGLREPESDYPTRMINQQPLTMPVCAAKVAANLKSSRALMIWNSVDSVNLASSHPVTGPLYRSML
jgi:hypothetical protein